MKIDSTVAFPRTVRSFVRRSGRLGPRQRALLDNCRTQQERSAGTHPARASVAEQTDWWFQHPVMLEIGFGKGEAFLDFAARNPDWHCVGLEVHAPGLAAVWSSVRQADWEKRVRIVEADAVVYLRDSVPNGALNALRIFFPDPWHKKKHVKRRLIEPQFLQLAYAKLAAGGSIHLATDWAPYAAQMQSVFAADGRWQLDDVSAQDLRSERVCTRFEARGMRLGHVIVDMKYRKGE